MDGIVCTDTIWQDFLAIVREEVGSRVVETWFKAVRLATWDAYEKIAYLVAPNDFVKQWLHTNYTSLFRRHLSRLLSEDDIRVVIRRDTSTSQAMNNDTEANSGEASVPSGVASQAHAIDGAQRDAYEPARSLVAKKESNTPRVTRNTYSIRGAVNGHYRFENFVVGASNTLAFSAARAVADNMGSLYNPLFIYGGCGLGKTHLLHAIGNYVYEQDMRLVVLYQPADQFVNEFIKAIRFNRVYDFESRYKDVDVLLIDDIQFIANKEQTQETFFHIFNILHQAGKQLVLTSDSMPCDIEGLAERMRSRLEGGLVADIQKPSLEMRVAILQKKAEQQGYTLDDDVAYYIAGYGCSNIRELEGLLLRVTAVASLTKHPLDCALARRVLGRQPSAQASNQSSFSLRHIAKSVARRFRITLEDMCSRDRRADVVHARHVAMYLMKTMTAVSCREIASFFERKDHSTVVHAVEKVAQRRNEEARLEQDIRHCRAALSKRV